MDIQTIILIFIFISAFIGIAFEHVLRVNKSWIALFAGSLMWVIAAVGQTRESLEGAIVHASSDIFGLIIFLMGAMIIVEMLGHFRFFTWLEVNLMKFNISNKKLFWMMGGITFIASALLDNLTSTLVMIHIGKHLCFRKENFNLFVINTIIAANAGGAMSPVGDVTTIMMWLAGKFTAWQILFSGFLPSVIAWVIPQIILTSQVKRVDRESTEKKEVLPLQWGIIILGFSTFGLAVLVNILHLPPFFGILFGLGVVAIVIDVKMRRGTLRKKANKIINITREIDMATINFFVGILLAVNALEFNGILARVADIIFGIDPASNAMALISGHISLGLLSSVLDNVPLTAAVIKMLPDGINYIYWVLLAITAGTGGSILIIGSAAGVAAMGQVEDLTFIEYMKKGTLPALSGYAGAIICWYLLFMT